MRIFLTPFLLLLATLSTPACLAQQTALVNAPGPTPANTPETFSTTGVPAAAFAITPAPIPRTGTKPGFALRDWTLLGSAATFRLLDYKSTVRCVSDPTGCKEIQLPQALVHNKPALGAFEAGTVVVDYYVYRLFLRHDHRTVARVGQSIYSGAMAFTVAHNYYEIDKLWPHRNLPIEIDPRP
jgi:hypothetical protein